MTTYIAASLPTDTSANPFIALWTLPFTLTQTWLSAWTRSDAGNAEQPFTSVQDEQLPVPAPFQENSDTSFA